MKKYFAIFRIRFSGTLQYRTAALAGIVTQFFWGFMLILSFIAFYRADASAFPMELSHTVSYVWMQQAFLAMYMIWFYDNSLFDAISQGHVAYELVRPADLYFRWFARLSATRLAKTVLRCFPILIVASFLPEPYKLILPNSLGTLLAFLLSSFLALGVVVSFSMFIYIGSFYTLSSHGLRSISTAVVDFLSGSLIPIPFFPGVFRTIAEALPFAAMQNMPLRIYSGDISGDAVTEGLLFQIFWLTVFTVSGKIAMKRALGKVIVQGG